MMIHNKTNCSMYHIYPLNEANKNIKVRSFKSSENIKKKEGGPDSPVLNNI